MTDAFPRDEATIRLSTRDQHAIRYAAERAGTTVREYLEGVIARHADRLPLPPLPGNRPRESMSERRARLRAESPDGMSPYTRELTTITSTKENHA